MCLRLKEYLQGWVAASSAPTHPHSYGVTSFNLASSKARKLTNHS